MTKDEVEFEGLVDADIGIERSKKIFWFFFLLLGMSLRGSFF